MRGDNCGGAHAAGGEAGVPLLGRRVAHTFSCSQVMGDLVEISGEVTIDGGALTSGGLLDNQTGGSILP